MPESRQLLNPVTDAELLVFANYQAQYQEHEPSATLTYAHANGELFVEGKNSCVTLFIGSWADTVQFMQAQTRRPPMDDTTYKDALTRIQVLWATGAGAPQHPDHAEFHALYESITAHEAEQGLTTTPPAFQIDSVERLEWYVAKKADLQSRKARLDAQYKAMLSDIQRDEERIDWRFAAQAEVVLRQELGEKKRSLKFLGGTVGLRRVAARVSVSDEQALLSALEAHGNDLAGAIVRKVDAKVLNQLVKVEGEQAYLPEAGLILDLPGLAVKPASETFYVKSGKEADTQD